MKDIVTGEVAMSNLPLLFGGAFVAFVVGLASLTWLIRCIELGKLHYFAYWCIPLGIGVIVWQISLLI
jgi:undecaprenyl-diphosphatase